MIWYDIIAPSTQLYLMSQACNRSWWCGWNFNTLWPDNMPPFLRRHLDWIFLNEINWSLFLSVQLITNQHWFKWWFEADKANDKPRKKVSVNRVFILGVDCLHYSDVIMGTMASQITGVRIVYSTVYSSAAKRNIQAPRHWPLWGEFQWPMNSPHKVQ